MEQCQRVLFVCLSSFVLLVLTPTALLQLLLLNLLLGAIEKKGC